MNEGSRGGSCEEVVDASPNLVTVVIPTLNEAEAVGKVIDELKSEGFTNILVVDGYSNDGTPQIAMERGAKVIFQHGGGKAGALRTAVEHVRTQYMLVMDGDYTYNPKDIKRLLAHAARYDEVIGARDPKNISWLHRIGNKAINFLFRLLLGANLTDVCSGMYLLRTEAVKHYIVSLVTSLRDNRMLVNGPSARASIWLMKASRAYALVKGRDYVIPDDVKAVAPHVLRHRLQLRREVVEEVSEDQIIEEALKQIPVPKR
ncbi:MAG: glycosyltransferase [Candidatus Nezhaarchaeales archaeon]